MPPPPPNKPYVRHMSSVSTSNTSQVNDSVSQTGSAVFTPSNTNSPRRSNATEHANTPASNNKDGGAADKKIIPKKKKKTTPACCTVPIAGVFIVACLMIAGVFAAITAQSSISFTNEVESSVKTNLATALEGAMTYVTNPLLESNTVAAQFRAKIEANPERYACDDAFPNDLPGNTSNYNFMYDAGMYLTQRPSVFSIYQARQSKRHYNTDGDGRPSNMVCMADQDKIQVFMNYTRIFSRFDNSTHLGTILSRRTGRQTPLNITFFPISLIAESSTTIDTRWDATSFAGRDVTKYSLVKRIRDPDYPNAVWVIAMDHALADLKETLLRGTPPLSLGDNTIVPSQVAGAHTTMYDMNSAVVMSSTDDSVPFAQPDGTLFTSGTTPSAQVNDAYNDAIARCGTTGCVKASVDIGKKDVRTYLRVNNANANLHLLMVSSVPRDYFFADADRTFATTLGLSVVSCVVIIAGCVALLVLIHRPLSSLKENMMLAANLHNDRVEHTSTYLRDIALLSAVFDGMNQQLLVARSFVPEAVLLGKSEDSQDDEGSEISKYQDDVDDEGSVADDRASHLTNATKITATSRLNGPSMMAGTNNSSQNSSNGMAKLFNVAEKRVGVLSLNLVGFHALCAPERHMTRAQKIHELSTALLTMAVRCAHGERGVMDSFHGDHFTLTFNASRAVAGPLAAAVRTANAFISEVRESGQFGGCGGVAAGAASGRAHVGTFGIDGYRRMSVVGEAYRTANALQQAAVQFLRMNGGAVREGCMIEEAALKELGNCAFHLQVVGCMQSSAHRASNGKITPTTAYFAHSANQDQSAIEAMKAGGEWLYELDVIESSDPYQESNDAMLALMNGDVELCRQLVDSHESNTGHVQSHMQPTGGGRKSVSSSFDGSGSTILDAGSTSVPGGSTPWSLVYKNYTMACEVQQRIAVATPDQQMSEGVHNTLFPFRLFTQ